MALTSNEDSIPDVLLRPSQSRGAHTYVDVNPTVGPGKPALLFGAAAVFASIRNLFLCPPGGRARIFQEDYFSGVYNLLQEPFDGITAAQLSVAIYDALRRWEPRVTINSSDVTVQPDARIPGYRVQITMTVNNATYSNEYLLRT